MGRLKKDCIKTILIDIKTLKALTCNDACIFIFGNK